MDLGIAGKTALVTGASAGIGRAIALALAAEGACVAVTYHRNAEAGEAVRQQVVASGGDAIAVPYDLTDDESIRVAVQATTDRFGGLDILVANAHYGAFSPDFGVPFEAVPPERWRATIGAVLEGTYLTIQAALPAMRRQGWGRLVTISSAAGDAGLPGAGAFSAAKSALHGLVRTLAQELGPSGILVNNVLPGLTLTERITATLPPPALEQWKARTPSGRLSTPEDVATVVTFLASAANRNVTGQDIKATGGV
jgi:NAD(P)-dependent dehydrogenase (short-subunit alcohol dehydrogenase family)